MLRWSTPLLLAAVILGLSSASSTASALPMAAGLRPAGLSGAPSPWTDLSPAALLRRGDGAPAGSGGEIEGAAGDAPRRLLRLHREDLASFLAGVPHERTPAAARRAVLALPLPAGGFGRFAIVESPILAPALAARHPNIRTYAGYGLDDPSATVRLDLTPAGFHALVLSNNSTIRIDPLRRGDPEHYQSCYRQHGSSIDTGDNPDLLDPDGMSAEIGRLVAGGLRQSGAYLRTYRAAVAATGEYTAYHGGTVELALAAITTTVNRMTAIFEREVSIRLELVEDEELIIYTNGDTDPYTNSDKYAMLGENISNLDAVIGSGNYDVGHVFASANLGGVAYLGAVCRSYKAGGVSGLIPPAGDAFEIVFTHESGHQFGAHHTFNGTGGSCYDNRTESTAYEPGSGSTILSYAGHCGADDLQASRDDYFHWITMQEIVAYTTAGYGSTCPQVTATGVVEPMVQAPSGGFSVPRSTPFVLTAASGTTGTPSWCWEESDLGPAGHPENPSGDAPIFRSFLPVAEETRVFPRMFDIINNTQTIGELLPSYARNLSFKVTVRDVQEGGVGVSSAAVAFTVASSGPFLVTSPNSAVSWAAGLEQEVTWEVAGTDGAPVSCDSVSILLSIDGGVTFPTTLVAGTPNDGAALVVLPNTPTSAARIMVAAADNIFFDISDVHFTIISATWGACCFQAVCQIRQQGPCGLQGGIYQGFGTVCDPNPCEITGLAGARADAPRLEVGAAPNPGAGGTAIRCLLPRRSAATLALVDASGRLVRNLHRGDMAAGETQLWWDGCDGAGNRLPAGLYLARLWTEDGVTVAKLMVTR